MGLLLLGTHSLYRWWLRSRVDVAANFLGPGDLWNLLLLVFLVGMSLAPVLASSYFAASGSTPRFHGSDDAYVVMIASAQKKLFPPADLAWLGEVNRYHQGGPLLLEGLSRVSGVELLAAFYGLVPVLVRLAFIGGAWRMFGILRPSWDLRRRLIAIVVSGGLFFLDPIAVVWNVRNLLVTEKVNAATILKGVPVAGPILMPGSETTSYGAPLADVFALGAISNVGSVSPLVTGAALAAVYLTKGQTGAPVIAGLFVAAIIGFYRWRSWSLFKTAFASFPFIALVIILGPSVTGTIVTLGEGANLRALARAGEAYAGVCGSAAAICGPAFGLLLWFSRWVLPLAFACFVVVMIVRGREVGPKLLACFAVTVAVCCLLFASVVVVRPGHLMMENFAETHGGVQTQLWLSYDGYLERMFTEVSAAASNSGAILLTSLLAAAGMVELPGRMRRGPMRVLAASSACGAVFVFVGSAIFATVSSHTKLLRTSKVVERAAVDALRSIPVEGSVILTNELAFDERTASHLPLMNAWAPAVFGQQFWANDFMYNLQYHDVAWRFRQQERFWREPPTNWHETFVLRQGITHILQRRDLGGPDLASFSVVRIVFENERYRVGEVLSRRAVESEERIEESRRRSGQS